MLIRKSDFKDAEFLPAIEHSADQAFLGWPTLYWVATDDVMSVEWHQKIIADAYSIVAVDQEDLPIGFLNAELLCGNLHILELAVKQQYQGQGIGRKLLFYAIEEARREGIQAITLTTFQDVPWNQGFYESAGFHIVNDGELTPPLQAVLADEIENGFLPETRCAMRLFLRAFRER